MATTDEEVDEPTFEVLQDVIEVQHTPLLGEGAFGTVHYAVLIEGSRAIALKAISKRLTQRAAASGGAEQSLAEILYGEVKILEGLAAGRHRNMLRFHGWWEDDRHVYLAQQLCMGGELPDWLSRQPVYTEAVAAKVTYDLLQALTYCHGLGVVHRDVKPQNLLFTSAAPDAYMKLADWGLAVHWKTGEPALQEFCGTLDYCAPEMLDGSYTATCDVWSAGVLLHVLLTGRNPFRGPSVGATEHRIRNAELRWEEIGASEGAREMLRALLIPGPGRPTSREAVRSVWLKTRVDREAAHLRESIPTDLQRMCDQLVAGVGDSPFGSERSEQSQRSVDTPSSSDDEGVTGAVIAPAPGLASRMLQRIAEVPGAAASVARPFVARQASAGRLSSATAKDKSKGAPSAFRLSATARRSQPGAPAGGANAGMSEAEGSAGDVVAGANSTEAKDTQLAWLHRMEEEADSHVNSHINSPISAGPALRRSSAAADAASPATGALPATLASASAAFQLSGACSPMSAASDTEGATVPLGGQLLQHPRELVQLYELLGGDLGLVVMKRPNSRMGRVRAALVRWQSRRLWFSLQTHCLAYGAPPRRPIRSFSQSVVGAAARALPPSPLSRGASSGTPLAGSMPSLSTPLREALGGSGAAGATPTLTGGAVTPSSPFWSPRGGSLADGELGAMAQLRNVKYIPISEVLSVRVTDAATLVLQCRRRVYTFRLPKSMRAVATQLAAVLQPALLYDESISTAPSFTPSTTARAGLCPSPMLSPVLLHAYDGASAASRLATDAAASLATPLAAPGPGTSEVSAEVALLAEEANAAVAAAMEAAQAARTLAERANAKVEEANAAVARSTPGSASPNSISRSASLPSRTASLPHVAAAAPPHPAVAGDLLAEDSTPSAGAPAATKLKKSRPFWEIQAEKAEKRRLQETGSRDEMMGGEAPPLARAASSPVTGAAEVVQMPPPTSIEAPLREGSPPPSTAELGDGLPNGPPPTPPPRSNGPPPTPPPHSSLGGSGSSKGDTAAGQSPTHLELGRSTSLSSVGRRQQQPSEQLVGGGSTASSPRSRSLASPRSPLSPRAPGSTPREMTIDWESARGDVSRTKSVSEIVELLTYQITSTDDDTEIARQKSFHRQREVCDEIEELRKASGGDDGLDVRQRAASWAHDRRPPPPGRPGRTIGPREPSSPSSSAVEGLHARAAALAADGEDTTAATAPPDAERHPATSGDTSTPLASRLASMRMRASNSFNSN